MSGAAVCSALWRHFAGDVTRHRGPLALAYGARTLSVLAAVAAPWALKIVVDGVAADTRPATGWVLGWTAFFLAIAVGGAVAGAVEKNVSASVRERLTVELRDRLLGHLLALPPTLRTHHRSGELVLRIVDDTDLFVRVITKTVPQVFQHALTLLGTLAMMCVVAPSAALAATVWLPVTAVVLRRDGRRLWAASREKRRREGDVSGLAQEMARGMAVIQATGGEREARAAFEVSNRQRLVAGRRETAVAVDLERTLQIVQALALATTTALGAWLVIRGRIGVGALAVLTVYVSQLLKPVEKLNDLAETTGRGIAGGERLLGLLDEAPAVTDAPDARAVAIDAGRIELRRVSFRYPDRPRPVLRDVSLIAEPTALTVLVGASGSGKTTILNLIVRLFDPEAGAILIDGHPLRRLTLESLRAQLAVVSQDLHLFAGSIRSALDRSGQPDDALWRALTLVSLDGFVRHLPAGLDAPLGEDGVNLSGGQRRRLALARAFLLDRPVVLLDEPLSNIDAESAAVVLRAIERLRHTATCLAITHDDALVRIASRAYRIVDGTAVEVETGRDVPAAMGASRC